MRTLRPQSKRPQSRAEAFRETCSPVGSKFRYNVRPTHAAVIGSHGPQTKAPTHRPQGPSLNHKKGHEQRHQGQQAQHREYQPTPIQNGRFTQWNQPRLPLLVCFHRVFRKQESPNQGPGLSFSMGSLSTPSRSPVNRAN